MGANAGGIAGSQVFRTQDAPLYINGFTACLALGAAVIVMTIVLGSWYFVSNKNLDKDGSGPVVTGATEETTPDGHKVELVRKWRWVW